MPRRPRRTGLSLDQLPAVNIGKPDTRGQTGTEVVETAGAERLAPAHEARPAMPLPRHTATFVALEIAPFRWLLLSTITGVLGFQMQAIALGWLVYLLTGSAVSL
ncbi:MAG: hypothetical protein M1296_00350, partial [Chloroflexi bacterium]|nr:hypothetical protein [Chloroflexota bacterium]